MSAAVLFYAHYDLSASRYSLSGWPFAALAPSLGPHLNVLLLAPRSSAESAWTPVTFDAVYDADLDRRFHEEIDGFGDFLWVDFPDEDTLRNIEKHDLAQLCYLACITRVYDRPFIASLRNRYMWIGHDNGWRVALHALNYDSGFLAKAAASIAGAPPIPDGTARRIVAGIQDGLVLRMTSDSCEVKPAGIRENMDELYELDALPTSLSLVARGGTWIDADQ